MRRLPLVILIAFGTGSGALAQKRAPHIAPAPPHPRTTVTRLPPPVKLDFSDDDLKPKHEFEIHHGGHALCDQETKRQGKC
jgi:hypothetical protein